MRRSRSCGSFKTTRSRAGAPSGGADTETPAPLTGPLCVECCHCGHKRTFNAESEAARPALVAASRRLMCTACGSRTPMLFRAGDDQEAKDW